MAEDDKSKADAAALLMTIMKEQSLATLGLRKALDENCEATLDVRDELAALNIHITGQNVMLARQTYVEDEMLAIMVGDPAATPPVPGREPTMIDRLKIIQEYEARLEEEAKKEAEQATKQAEAESLAVPNKEPAIITSGPALPRAHHPLPVVQRSPTTTTAPAASGLIT